MIKTANDNMLYTMENISEKIKQNITNFLQSHNILEENNILLVGFSAGADSLCLLDVLHKINTEYKFKLAAAHLNHNWRGEESQKEQEKAKNYCNQRNIEFYTKILPSNLPQTEEEARNQRYNFFNEITGAISATAILTGHTKTDNVETVLYRIIKGTGISGLKGIPEVRQQQGLPSIYRPLLNLTRDDCIEYCRENSLEPNFDPSNYNEKYLRNRIRHSLIPQLKTYNNAVEESILRLSSIAGESEEIIEEYLYSAEKNTVLNNNILDTQSFLALSPAVKKRVLINFLAKNNVEYTYERIENLLQFIEENTVSKSGKTFSIGKNLWFFVSSKELKLIDHTKAEKTELSIPVKIGEENIHPDLGVNLKIEKWQNETPEKFPEETSYTVFADLENIKGDLYLRTRRPGDIIQPFGMQHKTKLKKYLINRGVPEHIRDEIPILANEEEVLWAAGVGISELLRVKEIPSHIITLKQIF